MATAGCLSHYLSGPFLYCKENVLSASLKNILCSFSLSFFEMFLFYIFFFCALQFSVPTFPGLVQLMHHLMQYAQ